MFSSCFHQNDFSSSHRWLRKTPHLWSHEDEILWKVFQLFLCSIAIKAKTDSKESVFDSRRFASSCRKTDEVWKQQEFMLVLTKLSINFLVTKFWTLVARAGQRLAGCAETWTYRKKICQPRKSLNLLRFSFKARLPTAIFYKINIFRISLFCKNIFLLLYIWKIVFYRVFSFSDRSLVSVRYQQLAKLSQRLNSLFFRLYETCNHFPLCSEFIKNVKDFTRETKNTLQRK